MAFDYKKEYKKFYLPSGKPSVVDVPTMNFLAVRGKGNPNAEGGEYKTSVGLLYGIAYTIKMSYKGDRKIEGFFEYVVPPLEGFWVQKGAAAWMIRRKTMKDDFEFISLIRLPDFVKQEDVAWAKVEAAKKKKQSFEKVEFMTIREGLCVQCMHFGSYDDEPKTVETMREFVSENGYAFDYSDERPHHEIYLSDPTRVRSESLKTVIRLPIRKI